MKTHSTVRVSRLASLLCVGILFGLSGCSDDSPSSPQDQNPPSPTSSVLILSPSRGAMVNSGTLDISPITVSGVACDSASTIKSVSIGGQPLTLSGSPPCLGFSTELDSRWGHGIIRGTATNTTNYTEHFVQSYLRSPSYFASDNNMVPSGVYMQLNQEIIDDDVRASLPDLTELDDLASLLHLELASLDLETLLPSPLVPGPGTKDCNCVWPLPDITIHHQGYRVGRGAIGYSAPVVEQIDLIDGGISMGLSISNVSLPISVTGYLGDCITSCLDGIDGVTISGVIRADRIRMNLVTRVSVGSNGRPTVTVSSLSVPLDGLWLDIDWGLLEFLDGPIGLSNMTNFILAGFRGDIQGMVEDQLRIMVPDLVQDFIESFEPPSTVTLPPPMNTSLNVVSRFDVIDLKAGSGRLGIAVGVTPANPVKAGPMGSIQRGGAVPTFATTPYALGVGIKDDLLNQFLWAAWSGGALEIADISGFGVAVPQGFQVSMFATLPPVVMPGTNGYQIDLGVGDIYIEARELVPSSSLTPAGSPTLGDPAFYIATIVGATLEIDTDTDRIVVTVQDDPEVNVQVVSAPPGTDAEVLRTEFTALFKGLLPKVLQKILGSYPMPIVPIGAINLPGIPPDATWTVGSGVVNRQDAYSTITGDIVVK